MNRAGFSLAGARFQEMSYAPLQHKYFRLHRRFQLDCVADLGSESSARADGRCAKYNAIGG